MYRITTCGLRILTECVVYMRVAGASTTTIYSKHTCIVWKQSRNDGKQWVHIATVTVREDRGAHSRDSREKRAERVWLSACEAASQDERRRKSRGVPLNAKLLAASLPPKCIATRETPAAGAMPASSEVTAVSAGHRADAHWPRGCAQTVATSVPRLAGDVARHSSESSTPTLYLTKLSLLDGSWEPGQCCYGAYYSALEFEESGLRPYRHRRPCRHRRW